jgi:hypothetical protein
MSISVKAGVRHGAWGVGSIFSRACSRARSIVRMVSARGTESLFLYECCVFSLVLLRHVLGGFLAVC